MGKSLFGLLGCGQASPLAQMIDRVRQGDIIHNAVVWPENPEGTRLPLVASMSPLPGRSGRPAMVCATLTEVIEGAAARRESAETVLRMVERNGGVGHYRADLATGRIDLSDESLRIFGIDRTGPVFDLRAYRRMTRPQDWGSVFKALRRQRKQGRPFDVTHWLHRSDGEARCIRNRGELQIGQRGARAVLGTVHDVTEEQRVRESQRRDVVRRTAQDVVEKRRLERELVEVHGQLERVKQMLKQKTLAISELMAGSHGPRPACHGCAWSPDPADAVPIPRALSILTPRELQVCVMVYRGLSSKEIARQMGLSPRSVESHRNRARHKLGISDGKNLFSHLRLLFQEDR